MPRKFVQKKQKTPKFTKSCFEKLKPLHTHKYNYTLAAQKHGSVMRIFPSLLLFACLALLPEIAVSCSFLEKTPASSAEDAKSEHHITLTRQAGDFSFLSDKAFALIYNNDERALLDAYQQLDLAQPGCVLMSGAGSKTAVIAANIGSELLEYEKIGSLASLSKLYMQYADEDPLHPVCRAMVSYNTESPDADDIVITPLLARVEIRSLTVNLEASLGKGTLLMDPKVYLTNINGSYPLTGNGKSRDIINMGGYDSYACSFFKHPEMTISADVKGAVLYCYPNSSDVVWDDGQDAGSPTRLVIEGQINGKTSYYPIRIAGGHIEAGANYIYSIKINSIGTPDPEIEADTRMVEVELIVNDWIEKENETENF